MTWNEFGKTIPGATLYERMITLPDQKIDIALAPVIPTERWYWHDKQRSAAGAGRTLFVIWEDVWQQRRGAVIRYIRRKAGCGEEERLFARKLRIEFLRGKRVFPFYERNHVQGPPGSGQHWCLLNGEEIVAAMTFRTASSPRGRIAKGAQELTRYATSARVVGGASRLHTAFLRANPEVKHIVSYADKAMFTGELYPILGYERTSDVGSEYWVIENGTRYHKSNYQKTRLQKRFGQWICRNRTEKEICALYGLHQIYDCGKIRFDWKANHAASRCDAG